jgi:hypothetical protein
LRSPANNGANRLLERFGLQGFLLQPSFFNYSISSPNIRLAGLLVLGPFAFGIQEAVEFFDKNQKLLMVLLRCDQRTEFVDAVTLGLAIFGPVHTEAAVLQREAHPVCSMSNVPRIHAGRCRERDDARFFCLKGMVAGAGRPCASLARCRRYRLSDEHI